MTIFSFCYERKIKIRPKRTISHFQVTLRLCVKTNHKCKQVLRLWSLPGSLWFKEVRLGLLGGRGGWVGCHAHRSLHKWRRYLSNNTSSSKPHIHVKKKSLSGNICTRLRMYKWLLIKFRRHLCQRSIDCL